MVSPELLILMATGGSSGPEFALADLDGDGDSDLADFAMFQKVFGDTGGTRYTWNTENRLIGVEPMAPKNGDKKLQFAYDHMGKRVLKKVWTYTAGSWGTPTAVTKYVYDGWRVIMELDGLNNDAITRKYTWGLDLSGSLEGAGGIGGLLATEDVSTTSNDRTFIYFYEPNGCVGQLVETTTGTNYGTIAAKYEYDPYGKRINSAAPGEYDQPYRFSTKPVDDETGLGYWGYRYYLYSLGRWINRDPIGESGGLNLYGYVDDSPNKEFDSLGLTNVGYVTPWDGENDPADGISIKGCSSGWEQKIRAATDKACGRFLALKDALEKNSDCMSNCIDKLRGRMDAFQLPADFTSTRLSEVLQKATDYWCGPKAKGVFKCKTNDECSHCAEDSDPSMLTPPFFIFWFEGQPIHVCIDNDTRIDGDAMMHELLRQQFGDDKVENPIVGGKDTRPNSGWDKAIDRAEECASNCKEKCDT